MILHHPPGLCISLPHPVHGNPSTTLAFCRRRNNPISHRPLPIRNPHIPYPHDDDPHLIARRKPAPATTTTPIPVSTANSCGRSTTHGVERAIERIVLQVHVTVVSLLVRAALDQARAAVDGGADGGYGRRVEVEEQRRQRRGRFPVGRARAAVGGEAARL